MRKKLDSPQILSEKEQIENAITLAAEIAEHVIGLLDKLNKAVKNIPQNLG